MWRVETNLPVRLAVIKIHSVTVSDERTAFEQFKACAERYRARYGDQPVSAVPGVEHSRKLFHAIGQDPTKRRPSSEALLHRALKGKTLNPINTLVDVGNWCSLDFLLPICIYDADRIAGAVEVRLGRSGESFVGHNDQVMQMENRYVIADGQGPIGSPITDSQRTAVTLATKNVFLCIFAPGDYQRLQLQAHSETLAQRTLLYCSGWVLESGLL
ncbi:MAG TPA: phenylalanine--tRNA ligase beta subunit-related protein [bacterium]|nr:phenylalanine--tRNA ligase beta subunit-related protein [bacterium]HPN35264.1 phenylalanine--tRNA ligase beta subunit-related protein [bacterium]